MTLKLDEIHKLSQPETSSPSLSASNTPQPLTTSTPHRLKFDVPRFDGTRPNGWIFKINQFIDYHAKPENERLTIASFYMVGRALAWFQWMTSNEFEDLANHIVGLPLSFFLSCFISRLTPEIRKEVQAHQPLTLVHAAGLARLQEEKLLDARFLSRARAPTLAKPPPRPLSSVTTSLLPTPMKTPMLVPLKRLSTEELASRRERGFCFNCDERFQRGHKCASRMFLLIADEEDVPLDDLIQLECSPNPFDTISPTQTQITIHSL
ncbi:hypothetical protein HKD37_11G030560 [Glycine soja]